MHMVTVVTVRCTMGASSAAIDSAYGQEQAQASGTQTELLKASIIAGKHREIGRFRHTLRHVTEGFRRAW